MAEGRRSGRFAPGQSGNPAGRPRAAASAAASTLARVTGAMPEALAANIARVVAGQAPIVSSSGVGRGENGWQRLLRLVPDAELAALAAMDRAELAALAESLGGSLAENAP